MNTKNAAAQSVKPSTEVPLTREASVITALYIPLSLLAKVDLIVRQRNSERELPPAFLKQRDEFAKKFGKDKADKWLAKQEREMHGARKVSRNAVLLEALRAGLVASVSQPRKAATK